MPNTDPGFSDKSRATEIEEGGYDGGVTSDNLAAVLFQKVTCLGGSWLSSVAWIGSLSWLDFLRVHPNVTSGGPDVKSRCFELCNTEFFV